MHALYRKLLALYPRAFRERLGESMEQTFNDLWNERLRRAERGWFGFVLWMFIETAIGIVQEHLVVIREIHPMKNMLTALRLPAIIGFLIILPFIVLELTFVIIKGLDFDLRDALDSLVLFGLLWLGVATILLILIPLVRAIAGRLIAGVPIAQALQAQRSLFAHPMSLTLAVVIVSFAAIFVVSLVVDQYPCWIGVPNCD